MAPDVHMSNHHRATVEKLLAHPASGNVEWREVLSLLETVGSVTERPNGKFVVTLGPETETFERPREKDIPVQMVVDLRRMLEDAGLDRAGEEAVTDEVTRDHGDGRWGEPRR
jgi:hypothetical protein